MKLITDITELRKPCLPCKSVREGVEIGRELLKYLEWHNKNRRQKGVGLAANQLGFQKQVILIYLKAPYFLINPVIIDKSSVEMTQIEGCLSLLGVEVLVKRPIWVKLKCLNLPGEQYFGPAVSDNMRLRSWSSKVQEARVVLHELEHILEGKLIIDYQGVLNEKV